MIWSDIVRELGIPKAFFVEKTPTITTYLNAVANRLSGGQTLPVQDFSFCKEWSALCSCGHLAITVILLGSKERNRRKVCQKVKEDPDLDRFDPEMVLQVAVTRFLLERAEIDVTAIKGRLKNINWLLDPEAVVSLGL